MKKFSLALLLVAAGATTFVYAQPRQGPEVAEDILAELQIDDARAEEILAIMETTHEKKMAIKKQAREESRSLRKATHEQMATILTEEEMKSFKKAMREQKRGFRKGKGRCGKGQGQGPNAVE